MNGRSNPNDFVHLHVHSDYSLDGVAPRLDQLIADAARLGMPALALTDLGTMGGAYKFWSTARSAGIKPVIGAEVHVQQGVGGTASHLTMWAETPKGLRNLYEIVSRDNRPGAPSGTLIDLEVLARFSEGLIVSSGCRWGAAQALLRDGQYVQAHKSVEGLREIFGSDNVFVQVDDDDEILDDLLQIGSNLNLKPVATFAPVCSAQPTGIDRGSWMLPSSEDMRAWWGDGRPQQACDSTLEIADRCNVGFARKSAHYAPRFETPSPMPADELLSEKTWTGIADRYPGDALTQGVRERVTLELEVIAEKRCADYYLIVADYVSWARDHGILVAPGRGAAASSIVAYALGITALCPIEHGFHFERALNPDMGLLPDFDIDFAANGRDDVLQYVREKYGPDKVAHFASLMTLKGRQAILEAARSLGADSEAANQAVQALPPQVLGAGIPLARIFDRSHPRYAEGREYRSLHDRDPHVRLIHDRAIELEGKVSRVGIHAAGLAISRKPLAQIVPVVSRDDDTLSTQFDYADCESVGLVKFDFLGLANLTTIQVALDNILANRGERLAVGNVPVDDAKTFALLANAETVGVFQLDGPSIRDLLRAVAPDRLADLTAILSLFRPTPMAADMHMRFADLKNGRIPSESIHPAVDPLLERILDETYGLIVYQEQVMSVAAELGGFSLAQADVMRRALGKGDTRTVASFAGRLEQAMADRGLPSEAAEAVLCALIDAADPAFNKSHSASYALITYWTAYLKANYPVEYMAALLSTNRDDREKVQRYTAECRRLGIEIRSAPRWRPSGSDIEGG